VPATHEPAVEFQHLVDQATALVAVIDDQRRLAVIDADDFEVQVGMVSSTALQYSRSAALPRTTPLESGITRAATGEVKMTSS
jgi:hypothetical protein